MQTEGEKIDWQSTLIKYWAVDNVYQIARSPLRMCTQKMTFQNAKECFSLSLDSVIITSRLFFAELCCFVFFEPFFLPLQITFKKLLSNRLERIYYTVYRVTINILRVFTKYILEKMSVIYCVLQNLCETGETECGRSFIKTHSK